MLRPGTGVAVGVSTFGEVVRLGGNGSESPHLVVIGKKRIHGQALPREQRLQLRGRDLLHCSRAPVELQIAERWLQHTLQLAHD